MKTLKQLLVVIVLMVSISSVANNGESENPKTTVSSEISNLLKNPEFTIDQNLEAKVSFMINCNDEIVVLNVEAENENLDAYIKNRLNYNKLSKSGLRKNRTYILPVKIIKA